MKQRLSSLDVRIIAHELSHALVSLRVANIYDLSTRIFLLKFAKPNHREQLLVDSGLRCHLTSFARTTAAAPSHFVARLRKHLRTRRVTKVQQVGTDRVIEIEFSEGLYRLFLEFYAGGNVVLTDGELTILALLRTVSEGEGNEQYKLGLKLDLGHRQNYQGVPELTKERVKNGLQNAVERQEADTKKPGKKAKKKSGDALRRALAMATTEFPPVLIDHALHTTGYDRNMLPEEVLKSEDALDQLLASLTEARKVVEEIVTSETAKGYIIAKRKQRDNDSTDVDARPEDGTKSHLLYDDFHPFKPAHLTSNPSLEFVEFVGFNKTADEFFSSFEGQKLESRLQDREDNARRRIEAAHQEQSKRIDGLQRVQEMNICKAQAIEANIERVTEAVAAVNGLIAHGMDWGDIEKLIQKEQARNNQVAQSIKLPLKLKENTATLLLSEFDDLGEEDDMADETESEKSDNEDDLSHRDRKRVDDKRLAVDIDLGISAWANAKQYHDQKRSAAQKHQKTARASQMALKSTEHKVMTDLKKALKQERDVLRPVRKQFWFEKFIYFISSDKYLVLAGRDAQQSDLLYRKHLRKGDVYVHADLHGAASVVIKNTAGSTDAPVPPSTLAQAGQLAVCTSTAWDSKAGMSAWWVNAHQVSKTAPTGDYLMSDTFVVSGKKNFLPPAQLLLGFAVLFHISDESKANHVKHRLRDAEVLGQASINNIEGKIDEGDDGGDRGEQPLETGRAGLQQPDDVSDDDDDEFPDAPVVAANHGFEDANFSDAQEESSDDEESREAPKRNPLQTDDVSVTESGGLAEQEDDSAHEVDEGAAGVPESTTPVDEHDSEATKSNKAPSKVSDAKKLPAETTNPDPAIPNRRIRGKKGKAKKLVTKYADQDEEDRQLAMKLLGSRGVAEKRDAEATGAVEKKETAEEARARRRAQHEKAQREGLEAEKRRRRLFDEGVDDLEQDESVAPLPLDALVGTPLPGDEILEAIPICAPWSALAQYKYKAKIQPGQQKKGKAVREVLGRWTKDVADGKKVDGQSRDVERIWPREAELIKGFKEAEVVGIVPVKSVRVMMPGGGQTSGGGGKKGGGKGGRGGKGGKRK